MKEDDYIQRIMTEFPQLKWNTHRFLTHGWDHMVMVLDEQIVFRFPKDKTYLKEFKKEIPLLRYLKDRIPVGIPEYIYVSKDQSMAGYQMLRGRELKPSYYKGFSIPAKEHFAQQMAGFLTHLHGTPKSSISKFKIRVSNPSQDFDHLVGNTENFLFPHLSRKEVLTIQNFLSELKSALNDGQYEKVLTHSDLTWVHILWDNSSGQISIIDFSDRNFGDPAGDFTGLWAYGKKFVTRVYDLYQGKKDENLLYRSQLYFKRIPLYMMKDALDGCPCTFEEGYKLFKERY